MEGLRPPYPPTGFPAALRSAAGMEINIVIDAHSNLFPQQIHHIGDNLMPYFMFRGH